MKVLVTGSTAQQGSPRTANKTPTFTGLFVKALQDGGADVDFLEPYKSAEVDKYDAVVVGIAPLTSISASKVYPAMYLANKARKAGNLVTLLDAPEVYKTQAAIKSCALNLSDLTKSFYDKRKNYSDFVEDKTFKSEVFEMINFLYEESWPTTVIPFIPWTNRDKVLEAIPNLESDKAKWINPDARLLRVPYSYSDSVRKKFWTCDSPSTSWSEFTISTLTKEVVPTKKNGWELESDTLERINSSIGTLISTYRSGEPWWSPALAQSLGLNVPVVTDWKLTSYLGPEWSHLASFVEQMSDEERYQLAVDQKSSYLNNIPSWKETIKQAISIVNSTKSITV